MKYFIGEAGDHLEVICAEHKEQCTLDFKGLDPAIPLIEIICPKCGSSGDWKLNGAGAGFYTRTHDLTPEIKGRA
jgi:hypothetical protein